MTNEPRKLDNLEFESNCGMSSKMICPKQLNTTASIWVTVKITSAIEWWCHQVSEIYGS